MWDAKGGVTTYIGPKWYGKEKGTPTGGKGTVDDILEDIKEALDEYAGAVQALSTSVELLRSLQSQLQQVKTTSPVESLP